MLLLLFRRPAVDDPPAVGVDLRIAVNHPDSVTTLLGHFGKAVGKYNLVLRITGEGVDGSVEIRPAGAAEGEIADVLLIGDILKPLKSGVKASDAYDGILPHKPLHPPDKGPEQVGID